MIDIMFVKKMTRSLVIIFSASLLNSNSALAKSSVVYSCNSTKGDSFNEPMKSATIKPDKDGYLIRIQAKKLKRYFLFGTDNKLKINSIGENEQGVTPEQGSISENNSVTIKPNGQFDLYFQYNSRNFCGFKGNIIFLEGAKQKIFKK
jgi:hypothetical protein